jgi:DNA-binding NarL/FixJ family response regulator
MARWFARSAGFRFLGYVDHAEHAEEIISRLCPNVVLLDLDMPGIDALAMVARLAASRPTIYIAIVSGHANPEVVRRCLDAGACGYLSKDEGPADIAAAAHQIALGKRVLSLQAKEALDAGSLRSMWDPLV